MKSADLKAPPTATYLCRLDELTVGQAARAGCTLECWLHGSRFDLRSGMPLSLPATVPVAVYPVHVIDGAVYVDVTTAKEH